MKKLRLHREVVRTLAPLALAFAHGGAPDVATAINCIKTNNVACPSVACPTHNTVCSAATVC